MKPLIFSLLVSLGFFLLFFAAIRSRGQEEQHFSQRLRSLGTLESRLEQQSVRRRTAGQDNSFFARALGPFFGWVYGRLARFAPQRAQQFLARRLVQAGLSGKVTVPQLILLSLAWGLLLAVLCESSFSRGLPTVQHITLLALFFVLGAALPPVWLSMRIRKRQAQMRRQLPDMLDLLTVSVQAGLSFDAALSRITARMQGPLIDEFRRMQDDIRMGIPRRTAMRETANRCAIQDVSLFITSLVQSERLGTSMGTTLKNQADTIRERRRQYVRAMAMKAPVKMVFPIAFFILPALFIVTLLPTLLFLLKNI